MTAPVRITVTTIMDSVLQLVDQPAVQADEQLSSFLNQQFETLTLQNAEDALSLQDGKMHQLTQRLLDDTGQVRKAVVGVLAKRFPDVFKTTVSEVVALPSVIALGKDCRTMRLVDGGGTVTSLPAMAFGRACWAMYLGDVGEEPPLPPDIETILASPCPFWPGKRVHETHMLTLIPARVNGQPLTMKLIGKLVEAPKKGNATKYNSFDLGEYTDRPVTKAHWVLMTRDVLKGTRARRYAEQIAVGMAKNATYGVPTILDVTVSIFMEYVCSGVYLYGERPLTFTRCQEKYINSCQLVVGGFGLGGLNVKNLFYNGLDHIGMACAWQFVHHEP